MAAGAQEQLDYRTAKKNSQCRQLGMNTAVPKPNTAPGTPIGGRLVEVDFAAGHSSKLLSDFLELVGKQQM